MVPTQAVAQLSSAFPSPDSLPAGVVGVVIAAFAVALVASARRRDAD